MRTALRDRSALGCGWSLCAHDESALPAPIVCRKTRSAVAVSHGWNIGDPQGKERHERGSSAFEDCLVVRDSRAGHETRTRDFNLGKAGTGSRRDSWIRKFELLADTGRCPALRVDTKMGGQLGGGEFEAVCVRFQKSERLNARHSSSSWTSDRHDSRKVD